MGVLALPTTIRAELLARGIECRGSEHGAKELFRDGVSLGWFTADGAVRRFLPEMRA